MTGPGKHSCNRPFEWFGARALLCAGMWMVLFPSSITTMFASSLMMFDPKTLTALCIVVGFARSIVLWKNGELGLAGPRLRLALTLLAILLWAQFFIGLFPNMALGIPIYFCILWEEIRTCAAAARDRNGITAGN